MVFDLNKNYEYNYAFLLRVAKDFLDFSFISTLSHRWFDVICDDDDVVRFINFIFIEFIVHLEVKGAKGSE